LAPRAPWRTAVVASAGSEWSDAPAGVCPVAEEGSDSAGQPRHRGYLWAELMRRTFGIDVPDCPRCGGRLRLLALIEHARVVERLLRHLRLPTDRPEPRPPWAPPLLVDDPGCQLGAPADATFDRVSGSVSLPAAWPYALGQFTWKCRRSIWHNPVG
jgi:hypothetical protein